MALLDDAIAMQTMQYPGGPYPRPTLEVPPGSGGYGLSRIAGPPTPPPTGWSNVAAILQALAPWIAGVGAMKYAINRGALGGRPFAEVAQQIGIPEGIRPVPQIPRQAANEFGIPAYRGQSFSAGPSVRPAVGGGGLGGRLFTPEE